MSKQKEVTKSSRDLNGAVDFLFDVIDEIVDSGNKDADDPDRLCLKDRVRLCNETMRNIWSGARVGMEHKRMVMRAPDIANARQTLELGGQNRKTK